MLKSSITIYFILRLDSKIFKTKKTRTIADRHKSNKREHPEKNVLIIDLFCATTQIASKNEMGGNPIRNFIELIRHCYKVRGILFLFEWNETREKIESINACMHITGKEKYRMNWV